MLLQKTTPKRLNKNDLPLDNRNVKDLVLSLPFYKQVSVLLTIHIVLEVVRGDHRLLDYSDYY